MRAVKIGELKNNLSRYLKLVRQGETIRVLDRDEPIAELGPTKPTAKEVFARLVREGRCKPATTDISVWKELKPLKLKKPITMEMILDDLRFIGGG